MLRSRSDAPVRDQPLMPVHCREPAAATSVTAAVTAHRPRQRRPGRATPGGRIAEDLGARHVVTSAPDRSRLN